MLVALALAGCGTGAAAPRPAASTGPTAPPAHPYSVPLQPFVEDCAGPDCRYVATAPFKFEISSQSSPALPAALPVARYEPLDSSSALEWANRLLGGGWETRTLRGAPFWITNVEFDFARGDERLAVAGRSMSVRYQATAPGAEAAPCDTRARPAPSGIAAAWLRKRGFDLRGLAPTATPAPCGATVTWRGRDYGPDWLRHAEVVVTAGTVASAEFTLPAPSTQQLPHRGLADATATAVSLGSGPPLAARAEIGLVTELGNDGAWYRVPAAAVTAVSVPGAPGRVLTAYASLG